MIFWASLACFAGILVGLSRQLNGRLSLSTSAMTSSFWNHLVGFVTLVVAGIFWGGLWPSGLSDVPAYIYLGGPLGVVFVAAGSWVIARIGAMNTAMLMIGGQMVSGVLLDFLLSASVSLWASIAGIMLVLAGVVLNRKS